MFFQRFITWLAAQLTKHQVQPPAQPLAPKQVGLDKQVVIEMLEVEFTKLVGVKEHGNNRGPVIDDIVKSEHGHPGDKYCAFTCSYVIAKVCSSLNIDYPKTIYRGGSSQGFAEHSSGQYIISRPQPGALMVQQDRDNQDFGHIGLCKTTLRPNETFETIEANVSNMIRFITDRTMHGTTTKKVRCFVDVAQAIVDAWNLEQLERLT